ncbi:hypothetical protein [Burkholderia lata]|uniref:Uncharacterized protein n=1 Tax=Burkholderia lata (strain ATCC 17760 / DSM 23089 / LMG 22485 / NCIMB 9086 / R18194 / 383) TaxID=482957 RepID=A0A6P2GU62_BURL3|nr:hypothetical protein [Burkholderia lata]VWB07073.1 hypothetical protein BLA6863_00148 [Burkholderia lata]
MSVANTIGNAARFAYDLAYQQSPIILAGGSFASALGGMAPVFTVLGSLINDVTGSDTAPTVKFVPVPGATVINNTAATYPFANRNVAGNAVIRNPKNVSLLMIAPVNSTGGYLLKQALFMALQSTFEAHTAAGGTFHVLTPSYPFFDCIMTGMTDVTAGEGYQQQIQWQIDFIQPLVTLQSAQTAFNGMLSMISGGQQLTTSSWSQAAQVAGTPVQGMSALTGIFPSV